MNTEDSDAQALDALREAGSDLTRSHAIDWYLYLPTKGVATRAARSLQSQGFSVVIREAAMGPGWLCLAKNRMVPELKAIRSTAGIFESLAEEFKGEFDGWEAHVEPGSGA